MRVPLRNLDVAVTQNLLQIVDRAPIHHKVGCKRVSQIMNGDLPHVGSFYARMEGSTRDVRERP